MVLWRGNRKGNSSTACVSVKSEEDTYADFF